MDLHFDCTMCGRCCHDLKLPLSMDEAIGWIDRGGVVSLYCEALPWAADPAEDDAWTWYKGARAFPAISGSLPVRILVTLVAAQAGPCPFLQADMRCGAYEERPRVCRIYPAEINPLLALSPDAKLCPPEAWGADQPLFARDGEVVDGDVTLQAEQARYAAIGDVAAKQRLCALLGVSRAALANEGFVVHQPPLGQLAAALREAQRGHAEAEAPARWSIASNRAATIAMLDDAGASSVPASVGTAYIAFHPELGDGSI